jgi:hypothetical protein
MGGGKKQGESRVSFLRTGKEDKRRTFLKRFAVQAARGAMRVSLLRESVTATRAKLMHTTADEAAA